MKIKLPYTSHLTLPAPIDFSLHATIYSHGWSALLPFSADAKVPALQTVLRLSSRRFVSAAVTQRNRTLHLDIGSERDLAPVLKNEIRSIIASMLRLNESYEEFYTIARSTPEFRWIPKLGAGRLLRSQTMFEDVVKMICTTNCSWSLTEIMVENFIEKLGQPLTNGIAAFPEARDIAAQSERFLRKEISCGYRAPYVLELAEKVADGSLPLEQWRDSDSPTEELFNTVRSIKGVGDYAAGNLLKLIGRYDYLGLDSWIRARFATLHRRGRTVSDAVIERQYARFGKWRGLFCWMDMTHDWYEKDKPF